MSIPPSDPAFMALLASVAVDETAGGAGAARSEGGVVWGTIYASVACSVRPDATQADQGTY
eukprot:scaffold56843_cov32-Attheya_sp.AAC.2